MRKVIQLNDAWKFTQEDIVDSFQPVINEESWTDVTIPHTWNAIDGANGYDYHKGACWYRKSFSISPDDHQNRVFIEFNGANSITDVYMNGQYIGHHRGGYQTFRFDVTDYVHFTETNVLAVKVDNTVVEDVYPQMADFTFYGGIYRDVNLIVTNQVQFDLLDYGSSGIYIVQDQVTNEEANLKIRSRVHNSLNTEKKVRIWIDLIDHEGQTVAYAAKEMLLPANETQVVEIPMTIYQPTLWNGRQNPYLYQAKLSLQSFNDTIDQLVIPFGVRYFHVDPEKGFFLNGQHLRLNGVSRHQDRKDKGWAISKENHVEDMALIKDVGATSIRLAHYQHDAYFYDLCDQEGMVVWAEIPFISVMSKSELEGINAKQQMIELIRQNFNHPSIMFWGVQNEIQIGGERAEVRKLVKELNELTKQEDTTRLTTMANVMFVPNYDEFNTMTDIIGYNKYYGWYQGKSEDFAGWIDGFHQENPNISLGISEYGAEGIIQYHSDDPKVKDYTEEYHALYHETVWKIFEARPFLWSTYVWNMFDFGANIRDEGGVQGRNNKGLVTYDRKVKKDAFFMYKAHWSDEKFVHIASKRYVERATEEIFVKVYTNCENVTLFVSGVPVDTKSGSNRVVTFGPIKLAEGNNEIKVEALSGENKYVDVAYFEKVAVKNPSYLAPEEKGKGGSVANWFEMPIDIGDIEIGEVEISADVFSTRSSLGDIYSHPEAKQVFQKYLGQSFTEEHSMFGMAQGMTIDMLASMGEELFTDKLMYVLNKELVKIPKP